MAGVSGLRGCDMRGKNFRPRAGPGPAVGAARDRCTRSRRSNELLRDADDVRCPLPVRALDAMPRTEIGVVTGSGPGAWSWTGLDNPVLATGWRSARSGPG